MPILVNQGDQDEDLPELIAQDEISQSTAGYDSEDAFSLSDDENEYTILESAFGAQVTFIDDNNNVVTLGGEIDDERILIGQEEDPRESDGFIGSEVSNIAIRNSNSEMSEDDELLQGDDVISNNNKQELDEDIKPAALSLQPEGKSNDSMTSKLPLPLPPKIPPNMKNVSNEEILDWLEKQYPDLADSFAQEFHLSTNQSTRISHSPKIVHSSKVPKSRHSPDPAPRDMSKFHRNAIDDILEQYQELNEEGQKDLWLSALASNDTELIRELTNFRVRNAKVNSSMQLAKLTKDLLTHSEKHKVPELKYEEQAGK